MPRIVTLLLIFLHATVFGQEDLNPLVAEKSTVLQEQDGRSFRDLNKNGELDAYEDINATTQDRIADLIAQMTLEEKAGMLFIDGAPVNNDGTLEKKPGAPGTSAFLPAAIQSMTDLKMTHFNLWAIPDDPAMTAKWYNNLQQFAEGTRLGIPITIASDPRHHFSDQIFAMSAVGFSQFCEPLGFAAIGDPELVRHFADIARQEYLAVGMREALHPQIDLATEPRWARISGGFGEDAELTATLVEQYILGMQGETLGDQSIACMTKHFPGGGPQKNGLDPHFEFHEGQIYPGGKFDYHLIPFEAAIEANTAAMMPYYGVPTGQTDEDVAMAFNKQIITGLLREKYGYDGVVCTDWGLITDLPLGMGAVWPARAWGVEDLTEAERVARIIDAGCDQFGGESRPELVVQLVNEGYIDESRIDESLERILRLKFELGLFDNPFVDEKAVASVVGKPESQALGLKSQQRAMTLLKNPMQTLPLAPNTLKIYIENMDSAVVAQYATVVSSPEEADYAIIRLKTPWYPVETANPFAKGFHHGDLDFKGEEKARILNLLNTVPTIVDIYLDRPAVIPEIAETARALVADYGASDLAVCEVLFGNAFPEGNLPFELPSSMEAVEAQLTDTPYDSRGPLFEFGYGLRYDD